MNRVATARGGRGFTLVELMIAIGILSGVMVAIYASWASILRGSRVGMEAAADAQRMRMSMRVLEDSLVSVQMYQENLALYSFVADTSGDHAFLSFAAHLSREFPGSGYYEGQPVRRVTFNVEQGTNGLQLVMRQSPLLAAGTDGEPPYTLVLARELSAFGLEFWGQNSKEWEKEWLATNQLPKLVRVTLGFGHSGRSAFSSRPREIVTRTLAIPAMIIPRQLQMAQGVGGAPLPPGQGQPGTPGAPGSPGTPGTPGANLPGGGTSSRGVVGGSGTRPGGQP